MRRDEDGRADQIRSQYTEFVPPNEQVPQADEQLVDVIRYPDGHAAQLKNDAPFTWQYVEFVPPNEHEPHADEHENDSG